MIRQTLTTAILLTISASLLSQQPQPPVTPIVEARRALAARNFAQAKTLFAALLAAQPKNTDALLGLADSETGLHQYLAAERDYRRVTASQPQQWFAHKNLVIVEAALGRWEDFDTERAVLRAARQRHAAGLSLQDSDVIDTVDTGTQHWIVRDYATPLGRAGTLYNFERFSRDGRVQAYVSLESANALKEELHPADAVVVGSTPSPAEKSTGYALDFYDGKSHGTISIYAAEPAYERVRADFLRWTRRSAEKR